MQWIFASSRGLIDIDSSSHKIEKQDRKTKCYEWDLNSRHNIYITRSTPTLFTTRHTVSATLIKYVASERSAALKRKMFGMSDGGELGHFHDKRTLELSSSGFWQWLNDKLYIWEFSAGPWVLGKDTRRHQQVLNGWTECLRFCSRHIGERTRNFECCMWQEFCH